MQLSQDIHDIPHPVVIITKCQPQNEISRTSWSLQSFITVFIKKYLSGIFLTSIKTHFHWKRQKEKAFTYLKRRFTSAPILTIPIPSQDNKLHTCLCFTHNLSLAEINYNIGDPELLAIKLALEDWRDWLEGAEIPFLVWTSHRNLKCLPTGKRLNACQARWSLFFSRFSFILFYQPGLKNTKPDALSRWSPLL